MDDQRKDSKNLFLFDTKEKDEDRRLSSINEDLQDVDQVDELDKHHLDYSQC